MPLRVSIARMFRKLNVRVMMAGFARLSVALVTSRAEHVAHLVTSRGTSSFKIGMVEKDTFEARRVVCFG